jgi:hypothetical protein
MLDCHRIRNDLMALWDGELPEDRRVRLEEHLRRCPRCETLARELEEARRLLQRLPVEEPSANFEWKLRLRLAREARRLTSPGWEVGVRGWGRRFALSAAASFLVVLAAGWFWLGGQGSGSGPAPGPTVAERSPSVLSTQPYELPTFGTSGRSLGQLVAEGGLEGGFQGGSYEPIEAFGGRTSLETSDTLRAYRRQIASMRHRMRRLERQVILLQRMLERCQEEREQTRRR